MTVTAPASLSATLVRSLYELAAPGSTRPPSGTTGRLGSDPQTVGGTGMLADRVPGESTPPPLGLDSGDGDLSAPVVSATMSASPQTFLALAQLQALVLSLGQPNPDNFAKTPIRPSIRPPAQSSTTDFYA